MKKIFFVIAILVFGTIVGCGKSENKYVGKYVSEHTVLESLSSMKQVHQVLEIKKDGTWEISPAVGGGSGGEWKIDKDGIVLYAGKSRIPEIIGQIEGKKLINRLHGESFVKQN
jgi:hypothetical protein